MEEEENTKERHFRGGERFVTLLDSVKELWINKYGFKLSDVNATNMIADKIKKAGGIRIV